MKLDELGHDDPTIIKHLENLTGVNAQEIPLDDPETMSLFHSCKALKYKGENPDTDPILGDLGCVAVPEFGTKFVRGMVKETHPSTFAELVSISGLSHGTDVWLGNAAELVRKGCLLYTSWAKKRGLPRKAGHKVGAETFRTIATYLSLIHISQGYFPRQRVRPAADFRGNSRYVF